MLTDEKTDLSGLEELDFDPTCEMVVAYFIRFWVFQIPAGADLCDNAADWVFTCRGCGELTLQCEEHRASGILLVCLRCGLSGDDSFDVSPLPGGAR